MKKFLFLSFFVSVIAISAAAQQPGPTPPVIEDEGGVRISTNLIQIDVTVLDKNGKLVTDLTPNDFELYENGEKQQISNFSLITRTAGGATIDGVKPGAAGPMGPAGNVPVPVTQLKRGDVRRTIAIVVDDLNLSFGSVYYTRQALKK